MSKKSVMLLVAIVTVLSMVLAACGTPAPTEAPAEPTQAPEATQAPAGRQEIHHRYLESVHQQRIPHPDDR